MNIVLILILLGAFVVRVYNLNFNSPFLDEALYIMRGLSILDGNIEENIGAISWVGGFPFFYPLLSGIFYSVGGILATRFFNVILGVISVYLMYRFTKQLLLFNSERLNTIAGLSSAALMATTAVAITSSRLAIYDGLSFTLFLFGLVLWHKAIYSGEQQYYLQSAITLFLSFLAKYSVIIFFPFLVLIPLYLAWKRGGSKSIQGVLQSFCLPLVGLTFGYIGINFSSLHEFVVNQTIGSSGSALEVMAIFWEYLSVAIVLSIIGALFLWKSRHLLIVLLFGLAVIPLAVHVATNNTMTAQQQTYLSLIFLLPLAGAMFAKIMQKHLQVGLISLIVAVGLNFYIAIPQVEQAEGFWPNSNEAVAVIKQDLNPNDRVLAEGGDIFAMALRSEIKPEQVTGAFVFSYAGLEGIDAYLMAIADGYFTYVQLEGTYFTRDSLQAITAQLEESNYEKVYEDGSMVVYKRGE